MPQSWPHRRSWFFGVICNTAGIRTTQPVQRHVGWRRHGPRRFHLPFVPGADIFSGAGAEEIGGGIHRLIAKVLLIVSLTAPTSVGLFAIPWLRNSNSLLGWVCMWRLFGSPFVLVGIVGSRLLARFPRAKRLCSYAALVEAGTLGAMILLLGVAARLHR
jgi:hypothetical protein